MTQCKHCRDFFKRYSCAKTKPGYDGECDCPKCQGYCDCRTETMDWKQTDATTWQAGHWQISFGEFSGVYSVCWFDETCAIGKAAFDELDAAKSYCEHA